MSILDWIELLSDLNQNELNNLSIFCQELRLKRNEILFYEDDEASAMYFLKKWNMEILRNINWKEKLLWIVKAEEIIWEMAIFSEKNKRMATVKALDDCILIVIMWFSIKEITNKYPDLLDKIKKIINNRKNLNEKIL